jgi:hypothetical protein
MRVVGEKADKSRLLPRNSSHSTPALKTAPRIRIPNRQPAATTKVQRPTVVRVVRHGNPAAIGIGVGEQSAGIQTLVVHERFAVTSRVHLVEASTAMALRTQWAGRRDAIIRGSRCAGEQGRVTSAERETGATGG